MDAFYFPVVTSSMRQAYCHDLPFFALSSVFLGTSQISEHKYHHNLTVHSPFPQEAV